MPLGKFTRPRRTPWWLDVAIELPPTTRPYTLDIIDRFVTWTLVLGLVLGQLGVLR